MDLLVFILCAYGLTQILVYGFVFNRLRPNRKFFKCAMCIGFWVGVLLLLSSNLTTLYSFDITIINGFLLGCLSSGTSYMLSHLIGDNGIKIKRT